MKYSNLSKSELDGLLIGITDLYRLYNPSAIPSDEPPSDSSSIRYSLRNAKSSNDNLLTPEELKNRLEKALNKRNLGLSRPDEEKAKKASHSIRYSLGSSDEDLNEPQESFDANYSSEKAKNREEIRKAREDKENKQRESSRYKKLDANKNTNNSNSRNTLKEIREKGYSIFDNISLFIDNVLGKKRSKKLDYNVPINLAPTFSELLINYIDEKKMDNADVYKAAQIDRKHFSKIISNTFYQPKRDTVFSFIFALKLNIEEAEDLMATAGYAFSKSNMRDVVFEYFIRTQNYNIDEINEVLYSFNLDLFTC